MAVNIKKRRLVMGSTVGQELAPEILPEYALAPLVHLLAHHPELDDTRESLSNVYWLVLTLNLVMAAMGGVLDCCGSCRRSWVEQAQEIVVDRQEIGGS